MRKLLLSATALAALTAPVFAADLPARRTEPVAPVAYVPLFTWTGFYVGVNAGAGFTNNSGSTVFTPPVGSGLLPFTFTNSDKTGFVGGGQVGYNWQFGQFVLGGEADIQYADLGKKYDYAPFTITSNKGDWFGTVRARAGYAIDRALIYVTGGLAYGDVGERLFGSSSTRAGWTVGGGVEYAFTNNWTARLEGLYVNIDRGNQTGTAFFGGVPYTVSQSKNNEFGVVRVGLNYKF